MITIESNSGTEQDIADAMKANGIEPIAKVEPVVEATPAKEEKPAESTETPGEKVAAETEGKTVADPEPAKDKSQEKPPEEQVTAAEGTEGKEKAKGGFQKKIDKLTKTVDLLQSQIDAKDGNEARLRRELEEAQAALVKLQPAEPEKPKELVRPKRPKLSELDFDQEKYDTALEEYEGKLDEYHAAVTKQTVDGALKAENETRIKGEREQQAAKALKDFEERRDKDKEIYPDFGDLVEALPADAETLVNRSQVVADYIQFKSKAPIHLIRYLINDFVNGDEAEADRFMKMDDYDKLIQLRDLENQLIKEHAKGAAKEEETPVVTPKKAPEVATPAKEKQERAKVPDEPISPVGNGAGAKGKTLNEQMQAATEKGDTKEFMRLLALQHKEKNAAKA